MIWSLRGNLQGPTAISKDPANASKLGSDGLIFTPSSGGGYTLPIASATVLGGVKTGATLAAAADGTLNVATVNSPFLLKDGDVLSGALRFAPGMYIGGFNATDVYQYFDGLFFRLAMPGGKNAFYIDKKGVVRFDLSPICAVVPVTQSDLTNKKYVDGAILNAAYVLPAAKATVLGGVKANAGTPGQYVNGIAADGSLTFATPPAVTNPVAGSVAGLTLWVGSQAQYNAIAVKDAKTIYNITA